MHILTLFIKLTQLLQMFLKPDSSSLSIQNSVWLPELIILFNLLKFNVLLIENYSVV